MWNSDKKAVHINQGDEVYWCVGDSVETIRNLIDELRKGKLLERIGPNKRDYWKVLSEDTEEL